MAGSIKADLKQWENQLDELRFRSDALHYMSSVTDVRVPQPVGREDAGTLVLAAGLLGTTLASCKMEIPFGTLGIIIAQSIIFMEPKGVSIRHFSLLPNRVLEHGEVYRLFIPAFINRDWTHYMFSASSLIKEGITLERRVGAMPFVLDFTMLAVLSHSIYVSAAWLEKRFLDFNVNYYKRHLIGSSPVSFAFSVLAGHVHQAEASAEESMWMTAYHAWVQLVVTTVLFRGSNFLGNISGIAAGIVRVFCPKPFLWVRRNVTGLLSSILGLGLENRDGDERDIWRYRSKRQLLTHMASLSVAMMYYLAFKQRSN